MLEFDVLERKDSYFICQKQSGYCRIVIDDNSQNLPLGKSMLHVEEISDRYQHHARDSVFRLTLPFEQQDEVGICTLATGRKNTFIYIKCLRLGGKWEPILGEWVFSIAVQNEVNKLAELIQSEQIYVEATFKETITVYNKPLTLFGYPLIKSVASNNKVTLHKGMRLMAGDLARLVTDEDKTIILAGSRVRLYVPSLFLDADGFHEDYLCSVEVNKKRKPKQKPNFPWQ